MIRTSSYTLLWQCPFLEGIIYVLQRFNNLVPTRKINRLQSLKSGDKISNCVKNVRFYRKYTVLTKVILPQLGWLYTTNLFYNSVYTLSSYFIHIDQTKLSKHLTNAQQ